MSPRSRVQAPQGAYIFLNVLARMVEWFKTHRLSRCSLGSAGSNPASRKSYIHINNNFRVIINFYFVDGLSMFLTLTLTLTSAK